MALRFVPQSFIENVFAKPVNVMSADRGLEVSCFLDLKGDLATPLRLVAELYDGTRRIDSLEGAVEHSQDSLVIIVLHNFASISLWDLESAETLRRQSEVV